MVVKGPHAVRGAARSLLRRRAARPPTQNARYCILQGIRSRERTEQAQTGAQN